MATEKLERTKADTLIYVELAMLQTSQKQLSASHSNIELLIESLVRLRCLDPSMTVRQLIDAKLPCQKLTDGYWLTIKRAGQ